MATEIDIAVTTTTYNVSITAEPNEYIVNITTNGGGGIESVTGTTVDNTDPLNPVVGVPNLTQVIEEGDLLLNYAGVSADTFTTFALNDRLTENVYDTQNATTGGLFLDKDVIFPLYSTIRFQAGFIGNSSGDSATLQPYKLTTDAIIFYQGSPITDITLQPTDYCMLKCSGDDGSGVQIWNLTVVNKSSGGSAPSSPYTEILFAPAQSGAPDEAPTFTYLNNPTSATLSFTYDAVGDYTLNADEPIFSGICFPTTNDNDNNVDTVLISTADGSGVRRILIYKIDSSSYKIKTYFGMSDSIGDGIINGSQLLSIKIFT